MVHGPGPRRSMREFMMNSLNEGHSFDDLHFYDIIYTCIIIILICVHLCICFYDIYLLLVDDAWKKENNSYVVHLLIFKIECTT
jgi:hypothetical protein